MAGKIFINYRRGDDPGFAGRLYDRLEDSFSPDQLFMDVDDIPAGHDFVQVLEDQIAECDVLLAVIGKGWANVQDGDSRRRLENPDDFVRIEIEAALRLRKLIIPVLVDGAEMPRAETLPESSKPLARRHAVRLTHDRFKVDAQGLIKVLEGALAAAETARRALSDAQAARDRQRAEEAALKAAEAARQEKERARLEAIAGLSPDQIAKAEELANWDFIKASSSVPELRDHLARFPSGVTVRWAWTRLEELAWSELGSTPSILEVEGFLAEFPHGAHAPDAEALVERHLLENEAWATAVDTDTASAFRAFLRAWPESEHVGDARARIRAVHGRIARRTIAATLVLLCLLLFVPLVRQEPTQPPAPPALEKPSDPVSQPGIQAPPEGPSARVVLYEEAPEEPQGKRFVGSAIWRREIISPAPGLPPDPALRADLEVPERHIKMTMRLRRNTDAAASASHVIEITFVMSAGFPPGSISNVMALLVKQAEQTRGVPLSGLVVKVGPGFFLIVLSAFGDEMQRNAQLLKERPWFDIPIVYGTGRRAILAVEKGEFGEKAFNDTLVAWGSPYVIPKDYRRRPQPGDRIDDPWVRSLLVTPSVLSSILVTPSGSLNFRSLAPWMRKPTSVATATTFGKDVSVDMAFDHFTPRRRP